MAYDSSSRIEPKRSHQWFLDGTEEELFSNKKQAAEVPNPNSYSGLLNSNISAWGNASCFHSAAGQFTERLFDHEVARPINFDDRNLPLVSMGNMNMGRKVNEDPFGIDPSFGLSISHPLEDPRSGVNYGGIRKVKVSQVKDAGNFMSVSMGHSYSSGDNSSMASAHAYSKADDNTITMGLSFNRGNDNMMMGDTFNREDSNFITMSQPFNKGDNSEISMGLAYRENTGSIPIGHSVSKDNTDNAAIAHAFINGGANGVQMSTFKENNNSIPVVVQAFSKDDCDITSLGNTFNQGVCNTILMGNKVDDHTISGKVDTSNLSIGHSFSKGESNIISFGGLNDDDDDPSGRLICSYDLLMGQNLVQRSEELAEKGLVELNATALGSAVQIIASGETVSKKKEEQKATKKAPPNNFPSNVRSLLSTGMLDGVPVKYIAWSREELRAIIKGSAYLCGCQSCSYSKAINAYEFERHAGCKTKHPNNHIYFENGKTVYGIVQELRNTPQSLLFDVIQTITGSPINQKSFRLWKESFLAATRELQRIYGKEEGKILS